MLCLPDMKQRRCERIGHDLVTFALVDKVYFNDALRKDLNRIFPNCILKLVRELRKLSEFLKAPVCHHVDGNEVSTGLRGILGFVLGLDFVFGHDHSSKRSRT